MIDPFTGLWQASLIFTIIGMCLFGVFYGAIILSTVFLGLILRRLNAIHASLQPQRGIPLTEATTTARQTATTSEPQPQREQTPDTRYMPKWTWPPTSATKP